MRELWGASLFFSMISAQIPVHFRGSHMLLWSAINLLKGADQPQSLAAAQWSSSTSFNMSNTWSISCWSNVKVTRLMASTSSHSQEAWKRGSSALQEQSYLCQLIYTMSRWAVPFFMWLVSRLRRKWRSRRLRVMAEHAFRIPNYVMMFPTLEICFEEGQRRHFCFEHVVKSVVDFTFRSAWRQRGQIRKLRRVKPPRSRGHVEQEIAKSFIVRELVCIGFC